MVSMSLFLKNGPCFILPSKTLLGGIFSRLFLLLLITLTCQVNMKILHINHRDYFISYFSCTASLSLLLAIFSLYQALGCWMTLLKVVSSYPALLLLPVFSFFTFGRHKESEEGLVLSCKWTAVNMIVSFCGVTLRMLLHLDVFEMESYRSWISEATQTHRGNIFYYVIACNCLTITFTTILFFSPLQYGVLLPSDPDCPHVLQAGEVVPLEPPQDPGLDTGRLKWIATGILVIFLIAVLLYVWHRHFKERWGGLFFFDAEVASSWPSNGLVSSRVSQSMSRVVNESVSNKHLHVEYCSHAKTTQARRLNFH